MSYKKLGDLLVAKGFLSNLQLSAALAAQETSHRRLGDILVERGYCSDLAVAECLSDQYGYPVADLKQYDPDKSALCLIKPNFALEHLVLPLSCTDTELECAIGDPMDIMATDELAAITKKRVRLLIAVETELEATIRRWYGLEEDSAPLDVAVAPPSRYVGLSPRKPIGALNWLDGVDAYLNRPLTLLHVPTQSEHTMPLLSRIRTVSVTVHPNLLTVFDWFEHSGNAWAVVERMDGENLSRILKSRGARSLNQAAETVAWIADAVDAIHRSGGSAGVISPQNIWVRPGTAQLAPFSLPEAEYGCPEAIDGAPSNAGDIYALGTLLWEMLAGENPHLALSGKLGRKAWAEPPTHIGDWPAQMIEVLRRSLSREPEDRYASPAQMARALRAHNWAALAAAPKLEAVKGGSRDDRDRLLSLLDTAEQPKPSFWHRLFGRAA